jgi:hypothetical protein
LTIKLKLEGFRLSAKAILEKYTSENLKVEIDSLSVEFKDADSKTPKATKSFPSYVLDSNGKLKKACPGCGRALRTHGFRMLQLGHSLDVGRNHIETRKSKAVS